MIRMTFGKHKGTPIENLPTDYIDWILNWMDSNGMSDTHSGLFDALDEEFLRRKNNLPPPSAKPTGSLNLSPEAKKLLPRFLQLGYRALSKEVHPDVGGTNEQMIALQELKQELEKVNG